MMLAALLEEMRSLEGEGKFRILRDGIQIPEMCQTGQCGGADFVDEASKVYPVQRGGKVEGSRGTGLVRRG